MVYVIMKLNKAKANKGDSMCESEMIEFEDNSFNHYIHHFDECDIDTFGFNEPSECLMIAAEFMDDII